LSLESPPSMLLPETVSLLFECPFRKISVICEQPLRTNSVRSGAESVKRPRPSSEIPLHHDTSSSRSVLDAESRN
jgi:hypothetical protein